MFWVSDRQATLNPKHHDIPVLTHLQQINGLESDMVPNQVTWNLIYN